MADRFFDTSAFAKYYRTEIGTAKIDALLAETDSEAFKVTRTMIRTSIALVGLLSALTVVANCPDTWAQERGRGTKKLWSVMFLHRENGWEKPEGMFDDYDLAVGWGRQITEQPSNRIKYKIVPYGGGRESPQRARIEIKDRQPKQQKPAIVVHVWKLVGGKYIVQPDKEYRTQSEYKTAENYYCKTRARRPDWNATWSAPGWPLPNCPEPAGEAKPYNPPPESTSKPTDLSGTVWKGESYTFSFEPGGLLVYSHDAAPHKFRDGSWSVEGDNVHMTIPHMDVEIRARVVRGRISTRTIPLANDQSVVPTLFQIRKASP